MIKKTFKTIDTSSSQLEQSLVCETIFVPLLDSQTSNFQQSIGYSQQVPIINASKIIKSEVNRDLKHLQKKSQQISKQKLQEGVESQSANQFINIRKIQRLSKHKQDSHLQEIKPKKLFQPSKWEKPQLNNQVKEIVVEKKMGTSILVQQQEEQIPDQSINFLEVQDQKQSQVLHNESQSLLISSSKADIPNAFAFDKSMVSQYVQSGDYQRLIMIMKDSSKRKHQLEKDPNLRQYQDASDSQLIDSQKKSIVEKQSEYQYAIVSEQQQQKQEQEQEQEQQNEEDQQQEEQEEQSQEESQEQQQQQSQEQQQQDQNEQQDEQQQQQEGEEQQEEYQEQDNLEKDQLQKGEYRQKHIYQTQTQKQGEFPKEQQQQNQFLYSMSAEYGRKEIVKSQFQGSMVQVYAIEISSVDPVRGLKFKYEQDCIVSKQEQIADESIQKSNIYNESRYVDRIKDKQCIQSEGTVQNPKKRMTQSKKT